MVLLAKAAAPSDWWSQHSTLLVGIVGIVVSGFVGPTITALWTASRERSKDTRALIVARRHDLRELLDEVARVLGGAVTQLRPLLDAQRSGADLPKEPADFLSGLVPLGQRLRLRLPEGHPVLGAYDAAREALGQLEGALDSQVTWDQAVTHFEAKRTAFLEAGRAAVQAPVEEDKEI
jgi:hypothetical protein